MSFNSAFQFVFANNIVEKKPTNKQLNTLAAKVAIGKLNPKPYSLKMLSNGNLVLYNNNNIWFIGTSTVAPYRLILQNSGILAVVDATDSMTWQS